MVTECVMQTLLDKVARQLSTTGWKKSSVSVNGRSNQGQEVGVQSLTASRVAVTQVLNRAADVGKAQTTAYNRRRREPNSIRPMKARSEASSLCKMAVATAFAAVDKTSSDGLDGSDDWVDADTIDTNHEGALGTTAQLESTPARHSSGKRRRVISSPAIVGLEPGRTPPTRAPITGALAGRTSFGASSSGAPSHSGEGSGDISGKGNPPCEFEGCTKTVVKAGRRFCRRHGEGRRCKTPGCNKVDVGGGNCRKHGGGRRCGAEGCLKTDVGGGFCVSHGGGKRCQAEGCAKGAQAGGVFCKSHGGGRRCRIVGCMTSAQSGADVLCIRHGGGKRCMVLGCRKLVRKNNRCTKHASESSEIDPSSAALGVSSARTTKTESERTPPQPRQEHASSPAMLQNQHQEMQQSPTGGARSPPPSEELGDFGDECRLRSVGPRPDTTRIGDQGCCKVGTGRSRTRLLQLANVEDLNRSMSNLQAPSPKATLRPISIPVSRELVDPGPTKSNWGEGIGTAVFPSLAPLELASSRSSPSHFPAHQARQSRDVSELRGGIGESVESDVLGSSEGALAPRCAARAPQRVHCMPLPSVSSLTSVERGQQPRPEARTLVHTPSLTESGVLSLPPPSSYLPPSSAVSRYEVGVGQNRDGLVDVERDHARASPLRSREKEEAAAEEEEEEEQDRMQHSRQNMGMPRDGVGQGVTDGRSAQESTPAPPELSLPPLPAASSPPLASGTDMGTIPYNARSVDVNDALGSVGVDKVLDWRNSLGASAEQSPDDDPGGNLSAMCVRESETPGFPSWLAPSTELGGASEFEGASTPAFESVGATARNVECNVDSDSRSAAEVASAVGEDMGLGMGTSGLTTRCYEGDPEAVVDNRGSSPGSPADVPFSFTAPLQSHFNASPDLLPGLGQDAGKATLLTDNGLRAAEACRIEQPRRRCCHSKGGSSTRYHAVVKPHIENTDQEESSGGVPGVEITTPGRIRGLEPSAAGRAVPAVVTPTTMSTSLTLTSTPTYISLSVGGMSCMDSCGAAVQRALSMVDGVRNVTVHFPTRTASVQTQPGIQVPVESLTAALSRIGFESTCIATSTTEEPSLEDSGVNAVWAIASALGLVDRGCAMAWGDPCTCGDDCMCVNCPQHMKKVSKAVELVLKAVDLSTTDEMRGTSEDTSDERS